jgi:putative Mn2+ efflux pump MntP
LRFAGSRFGAKHRFGAQMAGGAILILIGSNILVEHLSAA